MTIDTHLTRRTFLGATAALPAAAALAGCGAPMLEPDASMAVDAGARARDASDALPPDGWTPDPMLDGSMPIVDASMPEDAAPPEPACGPLPRIDLRRDCGAVGDGTTDDTDALHRAAAMIQAAGGGELTIPAGTYLVGRQRVKSMPSAPGPWYTAEPFFAVHDLTCLKIIGHGATLRLAAGLHYGAFDPRTGAPIAGPTTARDAAAMVGRMIEVSDSANVWIEGLELDGNCAELVLGGEWGDTGRQTSATGIWLNRCTDVHVQDIHTHHHGLDGITVIYVGGRSDRRMPHTLLRVDSEYNGRQGISWIGGWGLAATDCKFNHTGRTMNRGGGVGDGAPVHSRPGAGFDIEPNAGTEQQSRDGLFTRCEFVNNTGAALLASVGDGGYTTFVDCVFWGTTSYSLWLGQPGLRFMGCRIHGTAMHAHDGRTSAGGAPNPALATLFEDCEYEDREWTDGRVFRANNLHTVNSESEGATWRRCTFTNHQVRGIRAGSAGTREIFEECLFVHSNTSLSSGSHQSYFENSSLVSCHFTESAAVSAGSRNYLVRVIDVEVLAPAPGADPTVVDGPRVKWMNASSGRTGNIPPGDY